MLKSALIALAAGLIGAAVHALARAQAFPTQPIRLIVPFAPGGGVDIVGRSIAEQVTKLSGHAMVVENRTGAGGNVGSASVAKAAPDGYTLLVVSNSNSYNNFLYSNMQYDAARDLQMVVQAGRVPMVLLVSPGIPPRTVAEVVALAKAKPGALNVGSGGNGTSEHMVWELFKRRTGIEAQLRAAGITGQKRSPQLPEVPTFEEQGFADFNASVWWGVVGPAGMPRAIVAQLNQMINTAIATAEFRSRLESLGAQAVGGTPEQFAAFFAAERATWQAVIRDAGIKLE